MTDRLNHFVVSFALTLALIPLSAGAQDSGLLLGLRTSSDSGGPYRSYWIAPEKGVLRVSSGSDLIVPRRTGFWRVCVVSGHDVTDDQLHEWDSVIAKPATPSRGNCAVPAREVSEAERAEARCSMTSQSDLLFVGSDVMSREEHEESNCGAHYSGGTHVNLQSLDDGRVQNYAAVLDSAQTRALIDSTLRAARAEFADIGEVDAAPSEPSEGDVGPHLETEKEWAIERGAGHWQTVGHASCSPYVACGDMWRRFSVPNFRAPRKLVGHDELVPSFEKIKARVPDLKDAVSSPRRDLVVALTADSLLVFAVHDGNLGNPVARVPIDGRIVMAQWAVGRFVPVWNEKLKELLH